MKRFFAVILALLMLMMYIVPAYAADIENVYPYLNLSELQVDPGNPRADKPEYEFSWLDNVVIRYDANAVTSAPVTPTPSDYLYSETYEGFVEEVNSYAALFELNEYTVASVYEELTAALSYAFISMGFTDTQEEMRIYLSENGISLPVNEKLEDKAKIAVVYAALKYDAIYVLYEKEVTLPTGISLDEAMVVILSTLMATKLPSGIDSFTGLALLVMKNYVTEFEQLPVSDNPDASEIFHWIKIITASQNDYKVPLDAYDETTTAQKEYVDYAYYASILNTLYDIQADPIKLVMALQSDDEFALQRFVLTTMLEEKKVAYSENASNEELFDLACKNGYFALEQDFYADIYVYELKVPANCEKVWFTPFSLAGQLKGSDIQYVTIFLNGTQMSPNATVSTPLDTAKEKETVELRVVYDDKAGNFSETVYTYNVIKDASLNAEGTGFEEGDIVGGVQQFVDTIVPDENTAASQRVDGIFEAIGSGVSQVVTQIDTDVLTTYGMTDSSVDELLEGYDITTGTTVAVEGATSETKRFDSDYLGELIGDVFVTDADGNIVTTQAIYEGLEKVDEETIIDRVAETVKESPEVVAVPSSLIAVVSVAGYLMSRKHRDTGVYKEEETEDEE